MFQSGYKVLLKISSLKYQVLAGTLGLVLLLGMVPIPAFANVVTIDAFSAQDVSAFCDFALEGPNVLNPGNPTFKAISELVKILDGSVAGGWRICTLNLDVSNSPSLGEIQIVGSPDDGAQPLANMFRHMAGSGVETTTMLIYNGTDGTMGTDGSFMSLNLLGNDFLKIVYSKSDFQVDGTVRLTDNTGGDSATRPFTLVAGTNAVTTILIPMGAFTTANAALGLEDIREIKFTLDTVPDATDYDMDLLIFTMPPVGGEMVALDTTALLLAGAELNAIWILPLIAAIGIGAFVVSRKRN